ncbi:hypothetical protein [Pedobacter antarcticus]|uniref:hypothetical protein n=1 Tax=Pedobacter antarcticus TaxID=34086 RepID=UPI00292E3E87|nr:hypothetical protein [Pedobacter antarcticus]
MNIIQIERVEYRAPASWNELTAEQLITWMKICAKSNVNEENALRLAAISFYKIPEKIFFLLNRAQQIQLVHTLTFLFDQTPAISSWLIPTLNLSVINKLFGPQNRLSSSTIKEFKYCELLHSAYQINKDPQILDRLIAVLFRQKAPHDGNDLRTDLNEVGISKRAAQVKKLCSFRKAAILFNYQGCRNYLTKRYPTIFLPGKAGAAPTLSDLSGMIKDIAGGKFGNYEQTEKTGLYVFLDHLRDELAENKK